MASIESTRRWPRPALTAMVLAAALLQAACPRWSSAGRGDVPDSTFVATMVQLRQVQGDSSLEAMAKDSARREVLRAHGLTAEELERAARALAANPKHAMAVFREIDRQATGRPAPAVPSSAPRPLVRPKRP
jgi:hypothetical protein